VSATVTQTRPTLLMLSFDVTMDISSLLLSGCRRYDGCQAGKSSVVADAVPPVTEDAAVRAQGGEQ
jgi:hypothetical protein